MLDLIRNLTQHNTPQNRLQFSGTVNVNSVIFTKNIVTNLLERLLLAGPEVDKVECTPCRMFTGLKCPAFIGLILMSHIITLPSRAPGVIGGLVKS